jgi:ferredoxin
MNISILESCVGCGACAIINPEVFEIQNSQAIVNQDKISNSEELCIDAAIYCPVNAISILDY